MKKREQTILASSLDNSLSNTLNQSSRGSRHRYSSKKFDESLEPGFRESQVSQKGGPCNWEMWWKQKEENEGKLKDLITKRDYEGNYILF